METDNLQFVLVLAVIYNDYLIKGTISIISYVKHGENHDTEILKILWSSLMTYLMGMSLSKY